MNGPLSRTASPGQALASAVTHVDVFLDSEPPPLKIAVKGLKPTERQLLEGLVRVSQRRRPRLEIVDDALARQADVVLVDARDAHAMSWARHRSWLARRTVIWVDGTEPAAGHIVVRRPVQWPALPMLIARALESEAQASSAESAPAALAQRTELESALHPEHAPRVLVVDDSLAVRAHLRSLLGRRGYVMVDADGVEAALAALQRRDFDCVLMDVLMPGIDGYEGCRMVKERLRGVPVVMLTSKSSPFDRIRGKMAGCDAYLTKPVDPQRLAEVLAQHVRAGSAATAAAASAPVRATAPEPVRFAVTRPVA